MWNNKQKHRRHHVHIFVTLKKNKKKEEHYTHESVKLEFSPLASVCFSCKNTKPLLTFAEHRGFGSAHLCFTTCFPLGWMHALVYSPQPHDASINTQHNDYFILHFTPNFFLIFLLPLFHFSFWRLQLFPHIGPAMSHRLSLFSLHNFMANFRLFSEASSQPQLLFFFFSSFIPTSPLLSVSVSLGRIVTPFPFKICESSVSPHNTKIRRISK